MDKSYYQEYFKMERQHWWFLARAKILEFLTQRYIANSNKKIKVLNVGIATGASTLWLSKFGEVTSVEYDHDCCEFVQNELNIPVIEGSITDLPFEDSHFDLVCAFDVIEHVENHQLAVNELNRVLKPGGHIFVTVPAFQFLWSEHDEINHHYRRYTKFNFNSLFNQSEKLAILKSSYFNSIMFPVIFLIRMTSKLNFLKKKNNLKKVSDFEKFKIDTSINRILYRIFLFERLAFKCNLTLPFGVSILSIFKKEY